MTYALGAIAVVTGILTLWLARAQHQSQRASESRLQQSEDALFDVRHRLDAATAEIEALRRAVTLPPRAAASDAHAEVVAPNQVGPRRADDAANIPRADPREIDARLTLRSEGVASANVHDLGHIFARGLFYLTVQDAFYDPVHELVIRDEGWKTVDFVLKGLAEVESGTFMTSREEIAFAAAASEPCGVHTSLYIARPVGPEMIEWVISCAQHRLRTQLVTALRDFLSGDNMALRNYVVNARRVARVESYLCAVRAESDPGAAGADSRPPWERLLDFAVPDKPHPMRSALLRALGPEFAFLLATPPSARTFGVVVSPRDPYLQRLTFSVPRLLHR